MANTPTTLTVTVGTDGSISTNFFNFTGTDCLEAGRQLHELLLTTFGVETAMTAFTPKPELGAPPSTLTVPQADVIQEGNQ